MTILDIFQLFLALLLLLTCLFDFNFFDCGNNVMGLTIYCLFYVYNI